MAKQALFSKKDLFVVSVLGLVIIGLGTFWLVTKNQEAGLQQTPIFTAETKQITAEESFQTTSSQKLRDKIITYVVEKGDTVHTAGQKFGISSDTVKWANSLSTDTLTEGQSLKILPVTGVAHTVAEGDTIDSIAKKYQTDKQKIVDFPFNEFANTEMFALVPGQILIVPDGKLPQ